MSRPTLSVLLPNYNHARYLPQAIEAVVSQSRRPDEFIILDDASTDNSLEIIESYARKHDFIRLVRHETNRGVIAGIETLLATSSGEWLLFTAADDYVLPGCCAGAMEMAERYPESGVIMGKVIVADADDHQLAVAGIRRWPRPLFASPQCFLRGYLNVEYVEHSLTSATFYRRSALAEIGNFRPELGYWADTFAIRAIALKHGACYVPEPWATWRVIGSSYGNEFHRSLAKRYDLVTTIAALMRSEEFSDRFPESYVGRWTVGMRRKILDDYTWQLREPFGRTAWGMLRGRLLKRYVMLQVALRYHGNVAAFIQDRQKS